MRFAPLNHTVTTEEMEKSTESPPMYSFSSLPNDVALIILARISRIHHPSLSLVSKRFRSLLASRELQVTRTLLGKTEKYMYLCFCKNGKPCWYALHPTTKQKLIPIPAFPEEHPEYPNIVSVGSEIHLIGGYVNGKSSIRVFALDCRSHKWRILPDMHVPRGTSAAGLIDGKVYVVGGCTSGEKNWGEVYDPRTQNWEIYSPTTHTPDFRVQELMAIYRMPFAYSNFCFVAGEKILLFRSLDSMVSGLIWYDLQENMGYREVKGLDGLLHDSYRFISMANPDGGRRLTVWWVSYQKADALNMIDVMCAEISFKRPSREEIYGVVEWSEVLYTIDRSTLDGLDSVWYSAVVTH